MERMRRNNFYILLLLIFGISFYFFKSSPARLVDKGSGFYDHDTDHKQERLLALQQKYAWGDIRFKLEKKLEATAIEKLNRDIYKVEWSDDLVVCPENGAGFAETKQPHPIVAIITSNKPKHLERLLVNLIEYAYADPTRIMVFSDGLDDLKPILEKYSLNPEEQLVLYGKKRHDVPANRPEKEVLMSRHYLSMFKKLFDDMALENAIILEDDLVVTHDALAYFTAMASLYKYDSSIFCVSGWNDDAFLFSQRKLYTPEEAEGFRFSFKRHEHFGGLGWMANRRVWTQRLSKDWGTPNSTAWDIVFQRMVKTGDTCIYPESPRIHHSPHLERDYKAILNRDNEPDQWAYISFFSEQSLQENFPGYKYERRHKTLDLSYLLATKYDDWLAERIKSAVEVRSLYSIPLLTNMSGPFVYYYNAHSNSDSAWNRICDKIGVWGQGNGGVVRNIYKNVLETTFYGRPLIVVGSGSPFYKKGGENTLVIHDNQVFEDLHIHPEIDNYDKALLYRIKSDRTIESYVASPQQSCRELCESYGSSCIEADQQMLKSEVVVKQLFQDDCIVTKKSSGLDEDMGYLPIQLDDSTCIIPSTSQKISCSYKPPPKDSVINEHSSRLCICIKKEK